MGQFLRFAALIVLLLIGFGSGICGLLGLGYSAFEALQGRGGPQDFTGLVVGFSVVGVAIAIACWFGIRALAHRLRAPSAAPTPPGLPPDR